MKPKKRDVSYLSNFSDSSFERKAARSKPPKSILIVTEGSVSEPTYFRSLAAHWNLHPHVVTLEAGCEGIPANLVSKGLEVIKKLQEMDESGTLPFNQLRAFDEKWIVFDTDHAVRQGKLEPGLHAAKKEGFQIAHSTPCFEFWFCLHYELKSPAMSTCRETIRLLEKVSKMKIGSYSKGRESTMKLVAHLVCEVQKAVQNAKNLSGTQDMDAPDEIRHDETSQDGIAAAVTPEPAAPGVDDDSGSTDARDNGKSFLPSSIGMSMKKHCQPLPAPPAAG